MCGGICACVGDMCDNGHMCVIMYVCVGMCDNACVWGDV